MKTSKYIGIAYLLFISIAMFTTFVEAKSNNKWINQKMNRYNRTPWNNTRISKVTDLNDFKILVTKEKTKLSVIKDTINQFDEFYYVPNDTLNKKTSIFDNKINYNINGDTLFVNKTYSNRVILKVKNLEQIIIKGKSNIGLSNYRAKKLEIDLDDSKIDGEKNNIQNLKIEATNLSNVNFRYSKLDTIKLVSGNSKIQNGMNKTKFLEAKLLNNAELRTSKTNYLNVVSDSLSKYSIIENATLIYKWNYKLTYETIGIKCTKNNLDSNLSKVSNIVNDIDLQKINFEILEAFSEIKKEDLRNISLNTSKNIESKTKATDDKVITPSMSYNVFVEIKIGSNRLSLEQNSIIAKHYKEYIEKELAMKKINLK